MLGAVLNQDTQDHRHNGDDDHAYYARSAFTDLGLGRKLYDCSLHHFTTSKCIANGVLLVFSSTYNRLA